MGQEPSGTRTNSVEYELATIIKNYQIERLSKQNDAYLLKYINNLLVRMYGKVPLEKLLEELREFIGDNKFLESLPHFR